jgi:hypothetical protein
MCPYPHVSFGYVVGESALCTCKRWSKADAAPKRYAELTGTDLQGFERYRAPALCKLAVFSAELAARHCSGVGSGPRFETAPAGLGLMAADLSVMATQQ